MQLPIFGGGKYPDTIFFGAKLQNPQDLFNWSRLNARLFHLFLSFIHRFFKLGSRQWTQKLLIRNEVNRNISNKLMKV